MAFFDRIFVSRDEPLAKTEKRLSSRYPVGENYPVRVTLRLDAQRRQVRLLDLSCNGASVELPEEHTIRRGQTGQVTFALGDDELTLNCRAANVRQLRGRPSCGLELKFEDPTQEKTYLQLVEPAAIASSLSLVNPAKLTQSVPGLRLEQYDGSPPTRLRIWRNLSDRSISAFEFQLASYLVRWSTGMEELELARADSARALSDGQRNELIWLFYLTVPNLSKVVAPDVREYLAGLVATE